MRVALSYNSAESHCSVPSV